ncbi:VOC family protein [Gramella jeungdoensis]|uniref:VOC family protein n=1 Tax=Gramella jeungdoensis TaxID=708091 RepID=A0ABT0YYH9_9FLAO|nr:VOC family protein [Gramella jeungdoensis]MCM8568531.1 VOC family protein [Gramella jeungdoensis]
MKVRTIGIPVLDQEKALKFYTEKLGFLKHKDIPVGENHRWLTVVSKEDPKGPEVLLEPSPNNIVPAKEYQKALFRAGIPYTQFNVDDIKGEYERLMEEGVNFSMKPTDVGSALIAILDDTCGNHIQLVQMKN